MSDCFVGMEEAVINRSVNYVNRNVAFLNAFGARSHQLFIRPNSLKRNSLTHRRLSYTWHPRMRHPERTLVSMKHDPRPHPQENQPETCSHVTVEFARQAFDRAIAKNDGDVRHIAKECATGFVEAFEQCYPRDEASSIFFCCGPGLNGLIGLYAASALKTKNYEVAVHSAIPSRHIDMRQFCEKHGITLFDFVPSTVEFYYEVVIDGLLGVGSDGKDIREQHWQAQEFLVSTNLRIASLDAPTGWDLTTGPRPIDISAGTFIRPDLLVSFGAPLICAKAFAGSYHFVAGRHIPQDYYAENGISVPSFPGQAHSVLFSSSNQSHAGNGAIYGRPGQYNATLFTKTPRRKWVDIDDDMDLWDELD